LGAGVADFVDVAELFLETGLGCTLCAAHSAGRARSAHEAIKERFFILDLAKALLGNAKANDKHWVRPRQQVVAEIDPKQYLNVRTV
jgi:hypothetical protein